MEQQFHTSNSVFGGARVFNQLSKGAGVAADWAVRAVVNWQVARCYILNHLDQTPISIVRAAAVNGLLFETLMKLLPFVVFQVSDLPGLRKEDSNVKLKNYFDKSPIGRIPSQRNCCSTWTWQIEQLCY